MDKLFEKIINEEARRQMEIIGEFETTISLGEETVASNVTLGNTGSLQVSVYPETTFLKPHIHIRGSRNSLPLGDAIVYLDKCQQWPHETHQSILDKDQSKDFDKFMRSKYRGKMTNISMTNWEFAVWFWNNHHDLKVTIINQPDYTKLYKNIDPTNWKRKR